MVRAQYRPPLLFVVIVVLFNVIGRLAQLVEHLPYKEEVVGSSPIPPTTSSGYFTQYHTVRYGSLAQSVEQLTFNQLVGRSSRPRPTIPKYTTKSSEHCDGSLAQSVEQLTFNQLVGRSSRPRPTI